MCCNGGTRSTRSGRSGGVRRTPPAPTSKRTWTVTYTESGQVHTQEFTGGRSQELSAHRLSAQKRGSIRMSVTPVKPAPAAGEVTLSIPDTPTDPTPVEEPEEAKPVAKKTAAKKTTKKAVAAQ